MVQLPRDVTWASLGVPTVIPTPAAAATPLGEPSAQEASHSSIYAAAVAAAATEGMRAPSTTVASIPRAAVDSTPLYAAAAVPGPHYTGDARFVSRRGGVGRSLNPHITHPRYDCGAFDDTPEI